MNDPIKHSVQLKINRLKSLPALPEASVKILEAIHDPDVSIEKLAEVLALSPGLVARLLGLANSAYFGQARQINDLRTAIVQVLGLQLVRSLTVGIVLNVQIDSSQCRGFDTHSFWMHSLLTAVAAQKLVACDPGTSVNSSTVYTAGLLLHLGVLVIAYLFPQELGPLLANEQRDYLTLSDEINRQLGLSHYQVAYMLLNKWQLPDVYQMILRRFEDPDLTGDDAEPIHILRASQRMCCLLIEEGCAEPERLEQIAWESFIAKDAIASVYAELVDKKEAIQKLADAMGAR